MGQRQLENEDYQWLLDALGGVGDGAPQRMLARPNHRAPELFLPLGSAAAGAAALRRFHDGRTGRDLVKTAAAIMLAKLGMLRFAPGEPVDVQSFGIVERIGMELGEADLQLAITLGPRRRNRKPVLQLIRPNGETVGFAKVGWSPFTRDLVENEAHWLQRLSGALPDEIRAPEVLARIHEHDRVVVVTSALETSYRAGFTSRPSAQTVTGLARALGTDRRPIADLQSLEAWRTGQVGGLIDIDRLLERHGGTEIEVGIWHGDLTPWNTSTTGGISQIWDWEFADANRPVGFDLLHNAFERVRRASAHNEERALFSVCDEAESILSSVAQPVGATVDLYLCELIAREARLRGEGWDPEDLGPLQSRAAGLLGERLA